MSVPFLHHLVSPWDVNSIAGPSDTWSPGAGRRLASAALASLAGCSMRPGAAARGVGSVDTQPRQGGHYCRLGARTSLLDAANPALLLARPDLPSADPQDEEFDCCLAHHLVSLCYTADEGYEDVTMELGMLQYHITYAKPAKRPADAD